MNRFFVYEEYGATYESMTKDISSAERHLPEWEKYQKGLEALASSIGSSKTSLNQTKKALTINDLLVKVEEEVLSPSNNIADF